jgi:ribonuclease HI
MVSLSVTFRNLSAPLKIYFDGGCRPNPGEMQVAAVARGVVHHLADLGHGSSEQAEWLALLHGLRVAEMIGERDIILLGDAAGVIAQAKGDAKCRDPSSLDQFQQQSAAFERVRLRFIRRNQNLAGIALAKLAER